MYRMYFGKSLRAAWRRAARMLCALCAGILLTASAAAADPPGVLRVMALGDSLTLGYPFPEEVSYRRVLFDQLRTAGVRIDYVGSLGQDPADPANDTAHEGRFGATVHDILVDAPWRLYQPDVILLMAGTNDFRDTDVSNSFQPMEDILEQFEPRALIREIQNDYAQLGRTVHIFVSSIPPQGYAADGSATSRLTDTLPRLLLHMLADLPRPIGKEAFIDAFHEFLYRYALYPDMDRIFAEADADGSGALDDEEVQSATRQLALYCINQYIGYYNNSLRRLEEIGNVHFVDAGSVLALVDLGDGTHPASQEGYDRMAPVWRQALVAQVGGNERYWVGGSGLWSDPLNWSFIPGGAGGAGQPQGGRAYIVLDDLVDRLITRDTDASTALLTDLELDQRGTGNLTLRVEQDMRAVAVLAGREGKAHIEQDGALVLTQFLSLGLEAGSLGDYRLNGGTLRTINEDIAYRGTGTVTQSGGYNDVYSQLILASGPGTGTYTLVDGEISSNQLFVGLYGAGVFNQQGGLNRVQYKHYTAGDVSGVLFIGTGPSDEPGGEPDGDGTYNMQGGALDALRIVNRGTFVYAGGEIAAKFSNDAILRIVGYRQLKGDFIQSATGALHLDDALVHIESASFHISGTAAIEGLVYVHPAAQADLPVGATFDVLTAGAGIDETVLDNVVLPLLPDTRILRAAVADNTLRIAVDTVRCEDVLAIRAAIGQTGVNIPGDVNHDGIVNVRDVAAMAKKLPRGTVCHP